MRSLCPSIIIASASKFKKYGWLRVEWLLRFLSSRDRRHHHLKTNWSIDMELEIAGKSAIVCASSAGLGMGCAKALAKEGVNIVINGRTADALERAAKKFAASARRRSLPSWLM
jgi:hypothetical protein